MNLLRRIRLTKEEREELMEFRRQALLERMRDISEGCWAASWHYDLEADLYRIIFEAASPEYGMSEVTPQEQEELARCATLANCWFSWSEEVGEPIPITLDEARTRYQRIRPEGTEAGRTVQEVVGIYEKSGPQDWALVELDASNDTNRLLDWLDRASETYRLCDDLLIQLVRRHDLLFDLRYGSCDVRIVEPSWLPKEFPRAVDCTPRDPCGKIRRCVSCAQVGKVDA